MKISVLPAFVLLVTVGMGSSRGADAPLPPELENERVLNVNKEPPHATLMPYADLGEALAARRADRRSRVRSTATGASTGFPAPSSGPWIFISRIMT